MYLLDKKPMGFGPFVLNHSNLSVLLSINMNFIVFSLFLDDLVGQLYALLILTVAAAETSIGLAIVVVYYRLRGGISIDLINLLKS